jgi:hypothetical protein
MSHASDCEVFWGGDCNCATARIAAKDARIAELEEMLTRPAPLSPNVVRQLHEYGLLEARVASLRTAILAAADALDAMAWRLDAVATKGLTFNDDVAAHHFKRIIAARDAARAAAKGAE